MNKHIINFVNINKKLIENSTHFEMNFPINNLQYFENEVIGDVNSFKQMENILYFNCENLTDLLISENKIKTKNSENHNMDLDEAKITNIDADSITNLYVNSVNLENKNLFKNSLKKNLSNMNNSSDNYMNQNSGFSIGAPFVSNYNLLDDLIKTKNSAISKYQNLFISVYRENNDLDIYKINLENYNLKINESIERVFNSYNVSELPCLLSDNRNEDNKNDYNKSTIDSTLEINVPNNIMQNLNLAMPEQIFFDFLNQKLVLAILYKNGMLVFYEACFIYNDENKYISNDFNYLKMFF